MWKNLHPNIRKRIQIEFLSRLGSSLIFPFMSIYLFHAYNAQITGVLMMINIIISLLAGIYGGYLTDVFGRRRLLLFGEFIKLLASIGIVCANLPVYHFPWLTFVMMFLGNIASGLISPASEAMLIDVSTEKTRAFMYAINYWANNLALMIGMIIGGWLFERHFLLLTTILVIINISSLLLTKYLITETHEQMVNIKSHVGFQSVFHSYQIVLCNVRFVIFTLGGILLLSVEFQRTNFIAIHLAQSFIHTKWLGISFDGVKMLSLLTSINTAIIVLFTAPISRWITNRNTKKRFVMGTTLFTLGYALQAYVNTLPLLIFSSFILSFGELMYVPTRQSKLADLMPENKRGAYLAFNGSILQLGKVIASSMLIGAPFLGSFGIATAIIFLGLGAIILTLWALRLIPDNQSNM
ncbi:MFS transporter [Leuconostoc mesenteroides]|uniref:MDR family MFS transporter n=1 Tax=Leuconostoc mesenteroides TaxID=1245 RepID=UPI0012395A07|nr:MFS transporter [Leuconostoc mesenteroides]KAA8348953.1 MFS transporter [Leuconostoc mesenteroides]